MTCDCGSARLPETSPCTLRIDPATGLKGPVHSQPAPEDNTYNHNFQNRFCGCGEIYNAHEEKGTMFQCLGLATEAEGGCGEDWWHPECVVGLGRGWTQDIKLESKPKTVEQRAIESEEAEDSPLPPGFPEEDDFETFICYKCIDVCPWIRRYAGSEGFLPPVHRDNQRSDEEVKTEDSGMSGDLHQVLPRQQDALQSADHPTTSNTPSSPKKRKASEEPETPSNSSDRKKPRISSPPPVDSCKYSALPSSPLGQFSLFCREDFREHFCRCAKCYPSLSKYPQLLEEEESYEPPLSEDGDEGNQSAGTGSLLDRGEVALSNVDRVRAIGKSYFLTPSV